MGSLCSGHEHAKRPPRDEWHYELQAKRVTFTKFAWGGFEYECKCSAKWKRCQLSDSERASSFEAWFVENAGHIELCRSIWGEAYTCPHCKANWVHVLSSESEEDVLMEEPSN